MTETPVLKLKEAANYLRVSPNTLRRMVREEEVPFYMVGKSYRFTVEILDEYLSRCRTESK